MYLNATQLKAKQNPNLSYWIEAYKVHMKRYKGETGQPPNEGYAHHLGAVLPLLQEVYCMNGGDRQQVIFAGVLGTLERGLSEHIQFYGMVRRSDEREMREAVINNLKSVKL
jgi:hypothetical protein